MSVAKRALQEVVLEVRVLAEDPAARLLRGLAGHVLARRVTGRVVEARVQLAPGRVLLDLHQLARRGGRLGRRLDLVEVLLQPLAERARLARAREDEHRCALHAVVDDGGLDPAGLVEQPHAAVVAGDQRPLGRRERHVELALRVLAVDEQRAGEADRDLGDADEVLDVAAGDGRVEGVVREVLELDARLLADEPLSRADGLLAVVVVAVARHADASPWSGAHASFLPRPLPGRRPSCTGGRARARPRSGRTCPCRPTSRCCGRRSTRPSTSSPRAWRRRCAPARSRRRSGSPPTARRGCGGRWRPAAGACCTS